MSHSESPTVDQETVDFLKTIGPFIIAAHGLAILSTIFRLFHRFQTQKLWWDDFWAFFALIFDIVMLSMYISFPIAQHVPDRIANIARSTTIVSMSFCLWGSRISLGVTIVRLLNPGCMRKISKSVIILFGTFALARLIQKLSLCEEKAFGSLRCVWPLSAGIMEIVTDIITDGWLTAAPAYMLWHMSLPPRHLRLLQTIFSCAIFITLAGIVHAVFLIRGRSLWMTSIAHFENVLSLITCNLLVLVTYLYRVFWSTGETRIESAEETPRRPTEEQCTQLPVPSISIAGLGPTGISNTSSIGGSYISDTTSSSFFTLTTVEVDTSNFDLSSASRDTQSRSYRASATFPTRISGSPQMSTVSSSVPS
ncbi:hypothetical protein BDQ17DRAFT_1523566 [Cyathus striatus]|nr:hypothetical protein BDQ17DRAFT_1523566 [Cyathus striatus]